MVRQRGIESEGDEALNFCDAECEEDYRRYKDEQKGRSEESESDQEESDDDDGYESSEEERSEARGLMKVSQCVEVIRTMIEGKGCPSFVNEVRTLLSKPLNLRAPKPLTFNSIS